MTIDSHPAERRQAKLRLAIEGSSGSGKTMGSIRVARGLVGEEGKILLVDSERGSGELYANITPFDVVTLEPPYLTEDYIEAIHYAEDNGYGVVILDSISHQWAGDGGMLEQADKLRAKGGNQFTCWAKLTPLYKQFIDTMLRSKIHVIATMRTKQDWVLSADEKGKQRPEKLGLAPIQRDGIDYEFTTVFDVAKDHTCSTSKDRTGLFDGQIFSLDEEVGKLLDVWLNDGTPDSAPKSVNHPEQEEEKPRPKNIYSKVEVDSIRETYRNNGWDDSAINAAKWSDDVYDKDMINADFAKRQAAVKKVTGQVKL